MKLCLCLLLAACGPEYATTAGTTFATTFSCPVERQTITRTAPPADIASDPDRLELWAKNNHTYEVSGCGRTATLECGTDPRNATLADCTPYPSTAVAR